MPMHFLLQVGAVCCIVLLVMGAALWWHMFRRAAAQASRKERTTKGRTTPHPRLDFAAGTVATSGTLQNVPRSEDNQPLQTENASAHAKASEAVPRRPDWAYYSEDNGDLSDPEPGGAPASGTLRKK